MKGMRIIATLLAALACALPAAAQSADETAKYRHLLPHIADGGGWRSLVLVTNVSPAASRCRLELHGSLSMNRFEAMSGIRASGSTATFELPESGGYVVWGTRNESYLGKFGYATLDCSAPVVAQVVFASVGRSGALTGMATVPSSQAGTVFQFPVLTPAGTLGLAIANDTTAVVFCRFVLETAQRENQGEATLFVSSKTNSAAMLRNIISIPGGFSGGAATVSCDQQVAMIGLHFELEPNGSIITFTTLPPTILDTSLQWVANWERSLLEAFYDATGGPSWRRRTNWKTSAPLSSWYGVQTDAAGRVIALRLDRNNLSGTIPASLGNLTRLQRLDLSNNALSGKLPSSLTRLRQLRTFRFHVNAGLCVPTAAWFEEWLDGIADVEGPTCGSSATDRQVLEAFYDATGGPRWENSTNWKTAVPLSSWYGVVTDEDGRVVGLELGGNGLKGSLPAELRNLSRLERLDLSHNNLSGPIPAELGRLTHLEVLGLWGNDLSGTIPVELGKLTNLVTLELPANDLSGRIPSALGNLTRLKDLRLWGNSLSGTIPAELGDLTNLQSLELAGNSLSGWIPAELGDLTLLERLDLSSNNLSGRIPSALARLTNLVTLELGGNRLIGEIPMRLSRLPRLEHLSLSRNSLRGPIPAALGNLPRLETLVLFANKLTGPIPSELGRLTRLETLSLSFNQLSGELPSSLTNLRQLSFFRFLDNAGLCAPSTPAFEQWREGISDFLGLTCGSRPPPLSDRDALVAVFWATDGLSWSNVTNWLSDKPLDEWYGVFTDAEGRVIELKLDDNNLTGRIPASLANLSRLRVLNLNGNNLIGKLPADLGHLTNLQRLYLSSNNLSGEIPWLLTNLRELRVFWFQENNGLCEPVSPVFAQWSGVVSDIRGPVCLLDSTAETDRKALEAAYDAAGGPGWTRSTNWKTAEPLNEWHGVKTNEDGRVIELKLNNNALLGTMPASLGDLTHLRQLDLSRNGLRGMVEAKLGNLAHLERLWLSNNSMFGQLPWSLTKLWRLSVFHFQGNSELCAPSSPAFRNWFDGIADFRGLTCGPDGTPNHPPQPKGRIGNVTLQVGGGCVGGATRVEVIWGTCTSRTRTGISCDYLPSTTPAGRVTAQMESRANTVVRSRPCRSEGERSR